MFVCALILTASSRPPRTALTIGWLLVAGLLALLRSNPPAERHAVEVRSVNAGSGHRGAFVTAGRAALGVPAVLIVALCGMGVALVLPFGSGGQRFDPRTVDPPPVDPIADVSPLAYLQGQIIGTPRTLFTVTFPGDGAHPPVDRVRVAALDTFDGSQWTVGGRFQHAGPQLQTAMVLDGAETVTMQVISKAPDPFGPYLPEAGQPVKVSGTDVELDEQSGVLADSALQDVTPAFDLSAQITRPDAQQEIDAAPVAGLSSSLDAPVPQVIRDATLKVIAGKRNPYDELKAVESYVRELTPNDPRSAKPGSSYYSLEQLLADRNGYAEQHAALFAVMAAVAGMPSRVAVGYDLDERSRSGDTFTVSTADAAAWPEVALNGLGWVAFDPTPQPKSITPPPQSTPKQTITHVTNQPSLDTSQVNPTLASPAGTGIAGWLIALVTAVAVAFVLLTGILLGKRAIRRRRRCAGALDARVVGAWRSVVDSLREVGVPVSRSMAPLDAAHSLPRAHRALSEPIRQLSTVVSAALYAPEPPMPADVVRSWQYADDVSRQARRQLSWWRRGLAAVDPRPLVTSAMELRAPGTRLAGMHLPGPPWPKQSRGSQR
jgi:transglutaminase-like putative cysteine protease